MKTKYIILSALIALFVFANYGQSAFAEGKTWFMQSMDSQHASQADLDDAILEFPFEPSGDSNQENRAFMEDDCLVIESWMTIPFESTSAEEELSIENWMVEEF